MKKSGDKDGKEYFPENFANSKFIREILGHIVNCTDQKNHSQRNCYIHKDINSQLHNLEKNYNISQLNKGLNKSSAFRFCKDFFSLQSKTDLSLNPHTYFTHMFSGTSTEPGLVGALSGLLMNGNIVAKETSPFANIIEKEVGNITKEMFGFKTGTKEFNKSVSFITSGGTEANTLALLVGRNWSYLQKEGIDIQKEGHEGIYESKKHRRPLIILPESGHYSLDKIANVIGIGTNNIIRIRSNEKFRIDINDLKRKLDSINPKNEKLIAITTVFGTTEMGALDDIKKVYELITEFENKNKECVWKHIDAAHGGPALLLDEYKHLKEVFIKYDSITFDPHKLLWVPYGAGSVTFKDGMTLRTVSTDAPYIGNDDIAGKSDKEFLEELNDHLGSVKLIGSQSTQGALATYLTIKCLGMKGIKKVLEKITGLSRYFSSELSKIKLDNGYVEVINENPDLNLIVWRFIPNRYSRLTKNEYLKPGNSEEKNRLNKINEKIFLKFTTENERHIMSHTKLKTYGMEVQRACIMNPHTEKKDIHAFIESYVDHVRRI